ncbi:cytochrome P450 [Euzebya tangerina]|uniref:cytochrome P450 n=1 Tax=Euzebya tangerina TaxID=591198 RepID=UPI000E31D4B6|nr:cytochrome P450 [Euzebya tangerina]
METRHAQGGGRSRREALLTDRQQRLMTKVQRPLLAGLRLLGDPIGRLGDVASLTRDPYAVYRRLAEDGAVVRSRLPMVSVATTHAAVTEVLRNHRVEPPTEDFRWDSPLDPSLLSLDPPHHTRIRRLVAQAFTPRAISQMRARAQTVADELLDAAVGQGGTVDLMRSYASPLPITMICQMLGLPVDDMDRFREWGTAVALTLEVPDPRHQPRIDQAAAELEEVFTEAFDRRRAEPGDDVLTRLVNARDGQDKLSDQELVATSILILLAGFETTVNLIGNGVLALLHHPDQRRHFVGDPNGLAAACVEEVLRYDPPVQMTSRYIVDDTVIEGVPIPGKTSVVCLLGGANRDPAVFQEPDRFVIGRPDARQHLSFSTGVHHCLGAALARLEGEVALSTLFWRFPHLRQAGRARRHKAQVLRGLETFPVDLGPEQPQVTGARAPRPARAA